MSTFDHATFLADRLGSPSDLCALLDSYGVTPPPLDTARKWWRRGLPSDWLPLVLAILELEDGAPVSLAQYVKL